MAEAGYSYAKVDAEHSLNYPGFSNLLDSNYDAHAWQLFGEAADALEVAENVSVEPYLNLSYDGRRVDGLKERGGSGALRGESKIYKNGASVMGLRTYLSREEQLSLRINAGWMHSFGRQDPKMTFAFRERGDSFQSKGAISGRDAAVLGLGLDLELSDNLRLGLGYDGLFSADDKSYLGSVQLKWSW